MKKTLVTALALALAPMAMAGEAPAPVTIAAPAPAASPLTLEVGAGYNWAIKDLIKHSAGSQKDIDTISFDLTGVYELKENIDFTLRLGYAFGDESEKSVRQWGIAKHETDMHIFSLMPGFRYTHPLTEELSAYAGVNAGPAIVSVKDHWRAGDQTFGGHGSEAALAYSIELGLRYEICENIEAFIAGQFAGNNAAPDIDYGNGAYAETNTQRTYGVRCGVNFAF